MTLHIVKIFQDAKTEVTLHLCKTANSHHRQKVQKETIQFNGDYRCSLLM